MIYPAKLLPQTSFKKIEIDHEGYSISRTVPNPELLVPIKGRYKEELFYQDGRWEEFFDYSTNLMGHFTLDDIYIDLCGEPERKKYFRGYWDFKEEVDTPIYEENFSINTTKSCFFFLISNIHRKISFPFKRGIASKNLSLREETLTAVVTHTPTRSNFWHFSIRWMDGEDNIISKSESRWKEACVANMRALLMEQIIFNSSNFELLDESCFCNL